MTRLAAVQGSKWPSAVPDVSLLQLLGRRLFYSDIIDGETRYNEINDEFLKVFTALANGHG